MKNKICTNEKRATYLIRETKISSDVYGESYQVSGYKNLPIGNQSSLYPKIHNIINANHG